MFIVLWLFLLTSWLVKAIKEDTKDMTLICKALSWVEICIPVVVELDRGVQIDVRVPSLTQRGSAPVHKGVVCHWTCVVSLLTLLLVMQLPRLCFCFPHVILFLCYDNIGVI